MVSGRQLSLHFLLFEWNKWVKAGTTLRHILTYDLADYLCREIWCLEQCIILISRDCAVFLCMLWYVLFQCVWLYFMCHIRFYTRACKIHYKSSDTWWLRLILLIMSQIIHGGMYSISQEIRKRVCWALRCCGYAIVHNEFTWSIHPYSSGLLCWHLGNR